MKIKSLKYLPGFILILCINLYAYAQENNYFSPYLIGTYNLHMGNSIIQVVNPTAIHLSIYVAFFDDDENAQMCFTEKLSPNDLIVLNVNSLLPERRKPELHRFRPLRCRPQPVGRPDLPGLRDHGCGG